MIIGIDTGGTNVDGVLIDEDGICGTAKVPNTETRASIEEVIDALRDGADRFDVDRVVVATTLVVNAAVQDRLPPCTNVVIPGPGLAPDRSFFAAENHVAAGAVDHRGRVTEPLEYDREPSYDVRAITAKFADRNPELERELDAAFEDTQAVSLGNESGAGLTFPERAGTTVANARAKPVFSAYERAVEAAKEGQSSGATAIDVMEDIEESAEHIGTTAREFINTAALASALAELGYSEEELTSTVVNVVNNKERLAMWVPTKNIPAGVEGFDPANIAPLHQRASAGVLLWTDYLDTYLWQNEVLLTDTILDNNYGDLKQMYAGLHLLANAAEDLAGSQELSDAQLTAALSAGAAMMIVGQEDLTNDVMRITDEMRAPRTGGA